MSAEGAGAKRTQQINWHPGASRCQESSVARHQLILIKASWAFCVYGINVAGSSVALNWRGAEAEHNVLLEAGASRPQERGFMS